jgi:hypothetical protein
MILNPDCIAGNNALARMFEFMGAIPTRDWPDASLVIQMEARRSSKW